MERSDIRESANENSRMSLRSIRATLLYLLALKKSRNSVAASLSPTAE